MTWSGSGWKVLANVHLMLEFLKGPFLVLLFFCCILMTFLIMLSVILLSMLMILLVNFITGKTQLVLFDCSNNNGSIDVKMDGSLLEEKLSFKMLGLTFSSKLDCGSYIISVAKTASKKY